MQHKEANQVESKEDNLTPADAPSLQAEQGVGNEPALVEKAKTGDEKAFAVLVQIYRARLRNVIRKMVGHPDDTDDLFQDTLIKANGALGSFKGTSNFGTWLCAIGVNLTLDFLRKQKTWRSRAQVIYGNACYEDQTLGAEVYQAMSSVEFEYDVYEHIAYCWSCVARSLSAEENATLVFREFLGLTNREGAKRMGLSESVFRHTLARARKQMETNYQDLCVLVNKKGVCYQCSGLREGCTEDKRGAQVPQPLEMEQRIKIVNAAELDSGKSQSMHDVFYRRTLEMEEAGVGRADEVSVCNSKHD